MAYAHKMCHSFLPLGHLGFQSTRTTKRMQAEQYLRNEWSEIYFYGQSKKIAVEENC